MMGINIKNAETERLIRELAQLTGKGQTEVVTEAVRKEIESVRKHKGYGRYERMMAIAREMAPALKDLPDHGELLYDEKGLPK